MAHLHHNTQHPTCSTLTLNQWSYNTGQCLTSDNISSTGQYDPKPLQCVYDNKCDNMQTQTVQSVCF